VSRDEHVFREDDEAGIFLSHIAKACKEDDVVVMAWCVMSNHYHLAIRTGNAPLSRTMKRIQHRYSVSHNKRHRAHGPFWKGRYQAKLVQNEEYLRQLVLYIHLNPVSAGVVEKPREYQWSGHNELTSKRKNRRLVDQDETLLLFGQTRRSALTAYRRSLQDVAPFDWIYSKPGRLPWWSFGRPRSEELDDALLIDPNRPRIGMDGLTTAPERRAVKLSVFIECAATKVGVSVEDLAGVSKLATIVQGREMLALLAVERYGYQAKVVAQELGKHTETASRWITRAVRQRSSDEGFRRRLDSLDREIAKELVRSRGKDRK
jgi:REP element-mobilizing transposase RayT